MLLCQDKHPSTNFDCLYRMHSHVALARVAAHLGCSLG